MEQSERGKKAAGTWSRRHFLQMGAAVGGAAVVAPHLSNLGKVSSPRSARTATSKKTIRYLCAAEGDSVYIDKVVAPKFLKETGITVQVDQIEYNNLYTKDLLEFQTDEYDVYQVDQVWVQAYAKSGYLLSLDKDISTSTLARYYPNLLDICRVDGKLWSLPFSAIPVNYSYRKDILAAHGLKSAETWTDALSIAKETQKPGLWGYPIRGQAGNPITWTWLPMLWSFGGETFNSNLQPLYNNAAGLDSVDFYKKLYKYSPPGWLTDAQVAATMEQGDAVQTSLQMVFDTSFNNPVDSKVPGKIVVAGMPKQVKRATILGMWTQAVAANSSNKAEALQFIEYLARLDVATEMAVAGWTGAPQPAIYRTRNAPAFFTVLGEVLKYAQPPPLFPQGNQWFVITGTALQAALSGKQTVKRAMDEAASNVRALLA